MTSFSLNPKDLRNIGQKKDFIASKRKFEALHLVFDSKVSEAQFEVHVIFPFEEQMAERRRQ